MRVYNKNRNLLFSFIVVGIFVCLGRSRCFAFNKRESPVRDTILVKTQKTDLVTTATIDTLRSEIGNIAEIIAQKVQTNIHIESPKDTLTLNQFQGEIKMFSDQVLRQNYEFNNQFLGKLQEQDIILTKKIKKQIKLMNQLSEQSRTQNEQLNIRIEQLRARLDELESVNNGHNFTDIAIGATVATVGIGGIYILGRFLKK